MGGVGVGSMSSTRRRKGKANTKVSKKSPKKVQYSLSVDFEGESGVSSFIKGNLDNDPTLGNLVMLEPREWLDYACVGVTHLRDEVHAIYDLNILENIYAMMYAYEEFHYKTPGIHWYRIYKSITEQHVDDAREWVAYNTLRGADYLKENRPLFTRSHGENDLQNDWVTEI